MKPNTLRFLSMLMRLASCAVAAPAAAAPPLADPGPLFYTPAQRAQLEQARARNITQRTSPGSELQAPLRYDGVMIRSDGRATHWVDGRPQSAPAGASGLKPGQVRADGQVFEPYQVVRPAPAPAAAPAPAVPDRDPRASPEATP